MKKIELLAPAGNFDMLRAAIQGGSDAVYLAGESFGARAYAKNFSRNEIVEAIKYAHLYGVKVYITVNTLIYENEVKDFMEYIEFIHKNNVDAVLIQDLGMFDLVRKTYPNLELHASTQMHIHNLDGVNLVHNLGMKRVVLARETSIDCIKQIKKNTDCEIEVFVHGALCVSYSGQCLMSSLIGSRSANRGACVGACRLRYDILDANGNKLNRNNYPLSMKDLNSLEYIGKLIEAGVDSLKIEGRMKSTEYVYKVVSMYRMAIDNYYKHGKILLNDNDLYELKKIFNREYTIGFLNGANNDEVVNDYRPNHMGVNVGSIVSYNNGLAKIRLTDSVSIGSGLRVISNSGDIGISVNDFYIDGKLAKEASKGDIISIKVNTPTPISSTVVITTDAALNKRIDSIIDGNLRKVAIDGKFTANVGKNMELVLSDGVNEVSIVGNFVNRAIKNPTTKEEIKRKLNKLGDTVYKFQNLIVDIDCECFIPLKDINDIRRQAVFELNNKRLYTYNFKREEYRIKLPDFKQEKVLSALVSDIDTYNNISNKFDIIFADVEINNTIYKFPRVIDRYDGHKEIVMIGEIGGLLHHQNCYVDFSLNVVNSYTVAFLHSLGAKRITLSYELDDEKIKNIIDNYHKRYNKHPNVELIVSGYPELMICKYSLNKKYKKDLLYLVDRFGNKFRVITKGDNMYIYHFQKRDIFDNKYYDMGINSLRFNFD